MSYIDEDKLKKQLHSGEIANVYFLYGKDNALTEQYVKRIVRKSVGANPSDFNLQNFDGKAVTVSQIEDAVEALPVFAPRKCVSISNLDVDKLSVDELDRLIGIVGDMPDTALLLFYITSLEIKLVSKVKKLLTAISKAGEVCELKQGTPNELAKLTIAKVESAECEISISDAVYLANQTLCNRMLLRNEVDKLISFVGKGKITRQIIDSLVSQQIETSTFTLAKAVIAGNFKQALGIIDELFYQRIDAIAILSALSMTFMDLYRARAAITAGVSEAKVAEDFGYPKNRMFAVSNAFRDARRITAPRLRECITLLADADITLKSTRTDPRTIVEQTVVQMMMSSEGTR